MQLTAREEPVGATPLHSVAVAVGRSLITFFKYVRSSNGHEFKCVQETITIERAKSIDRAVEAARLSADSSDAVAWLTGNCTRTISM